MAALYVRRQLRLDLMACEFEARLCDVTLAIIALAPSVLGFNSYCDKLPKSNSLD